MTGWAVSKCEWHQFTSFFDNLQTQSGQQLGDFSVLTVIVSCTPIVTFSFFLAFCVLFHLSLPLSFWKQDYVTVFVFLFYLAFLWDNRKHVFSLQCHYCLLQYVILHAIAHCPIRTLKPNGAICLYLNLANTLYVSISN